ncbi:MAG: hypothetical protein RI894_709 [Bacteroidota bacterium]
MKRLPIGRQTFSRLREDDCLYIDKTKSVHSIRYRKKRLI